ncbi:MAG: hypothetical protein HQP61_04465 [Peptococcaceae bacterium]|nr:hypothetical protein [Candidatus Syntrophopropionicum ammoniitolerans]
MWLFTSLSIIIAGTIMVKKAGPGLTLPGLQFVLFPEAQRAKPCFVVIYQPVHHYSRHHYGQESRPRLNIAGASICPIS